jgi:DNA-binding NarL/FixJ family response regulator
MANSYRIVLAEDHIMVRQGIKMILDRSDDLEVVGEVGDGFELLELLKRVFVDMAILDISMPNLRGIEAMHEIRATHPNVKILILTMHKDKEFLHNAILAGARGYLLKEDADAELFSAIEVIRKGGTYVSPLLSKDLVDDFVQMDRTIQEPVFDRLTTREKEILKLIAEGKSNKEIAGLLFISIRTVENHRAKIMKRLGLRNTAELVKYAISKGYTQATM